MNPPVALHSRNRLLRWGFVSVGLIALAVLIPAVVLSQRGADRDQILATRPRPVQVGLSQQAGGLTVSLDSVDASPLDTRLVFTLTLPEHVIESSNPQLLEPIFAGEQLHLDGIAPPAAGLTLSVRPHRAGEPTLTIAMLLGPVADARKGATITIDKLPFTTSDTSPLTVIGPWTFRLEPALFAGLDNVQVTKINAVSEFAGVTMHVERVLRDDSGLYVYFDAVPDTGASLDTAAARAQLIFPDGSLQKATQVETLLSVLGTEQGGPREMVATFPPAVQAFDARFELSSLVADNGMPASVTIRNPFGDWSAEPITIGDDTLEVVAVQYNPESTEFTIGVENVSPAETATMMFGAIETRATLTDASGHEYPKTSGATSLRKLPDGSLSAGDTSVTFIGVDPETSEVAVTVAASGVFMRGPWAVDLQLPMSE